MEIEYANGCKYYEGRIIVDCNQQLFGQETVELDVMFRSEKERNIEKEIEKIKHVKKHFVSMYDVFLKELFTWKEKYNMQFEARDVNGTYHKVDINKKDDLHKYMGNPIIELLFYKEDIYTGFAYGDDCVISEDGISAIFLDTKLLAVDATDVETTFYNNIIYEAENK